MFATGYDKNGQLSRPQEDVWAARGSGNVVTNVEDLFKWMMAFNNKNFLSANIKSKLLTDYIPGKETYSWNKTISSTNNRFYHKGGGRTDFESQLMWFPDDDIIIIFLINNDYGLRAKLFRGIQTIMD